MVKMGTVWDRTTEFVGDHLALLLPIAIGGIVIPATIWETLQPLYLAAGQPLRIALGAVWLAQILLTVWAQAAITAFAIDPALGRGAGGVGLRRLPPVIAVGIALLVIFALLCLPLVGFLWGAGVRMGADGAGGVASPGMLVGAVVYGILLVPILFVFSARMALAMPTVVAERRWLGAIARSWRLTTGLTMKIIGVLILYVILSAVAMLAATHAFGAVMLLLLGGDGAITVGGVLTAIVAGAVTGIFAAYQAVFVAKLYVATAGTPAMGTRSDR